MTTVAATHALAAPRGGTMTTRSAVTGNGSVPPPDVPTTLSETGLAPDVLEQLLVKVLYTGESTGHQLAAHLCLSYAILDDLLQRARFEKLVEVRGTSGVGNAGYRYALTDLGRDRARAYMDVCQYAGPAPVPLEQYVAYVKRMAASRGTVDRARLSAGFSHLVVNDATIDALGPAVNSGKALFLYGPPGNGKTVVAEGCGRAIGGNVFVPHAIEAAGQIITFYDPINHRRVDETETDASLIRRDGHDRRWVRIARPVVVVGGELTLEMLDLTFNPLSRFYEAPIQLKANGGVFVVDDFGRQRISARELLNRWIVPLESRRDYLTLHTGRKLELPFDVLVIFATNLKPESLADEAFLRRIPYKIVAQNPTYEEFVKIFELNCRRYGVPFDAEMVAYLHRNYHEARHIPRRACQPRDLIEQVVNYCRYQDREPVITPDLLDMACATYFVREEDPSLQWSDPVQPDAKAQVA